MRTGFTVFNKPPKWWAIRAPKSRNLVIFFYHTVKPLGVLPSLFMNQDDKSFQLDSQARSFRVSDFALRDLPRFSLFFVFLTLVSLGLVWFLDLFAEKIRWICLGLAVGFYLGIVFGSWVVRPAAKINYDLSPEVQALAKDPSRLIAAIKLLREAHPEISLAAAKERIERFCETGQ